MIEANRFIRRKIAPAALVLMGFLVTSCGSGSSSPSEEGFSGGCQPYRIYAQDRWPPSGAAVRPIPVASAPMTRAIDANHAIMVDGWFHYGNPVYPNNRPPFNENIWFKIANQSGFVDFAGVRGDKTVPDPTRLASGGEPAPTPADCEGSYMPQYSSNSS